MTLTRVDTKKLRAALTIAAKKLSEAHEALEPWLVLLTDAERSTTARAPGSFPAAARQLAAAMTQHPELVAASDHDAAAVTEDLDNAEALAELSAQVESLAARLADSRLAWLAEAYLPSLQLHGMARVKARQDARLERAIGPLAAVFAARRSRKDRSPDGSV